MGKIIENEKTPPTPRSEGTKEEDEVYESDFESDSDKEESNETNPLSANAAIVVKRTCCASVRQRKKHTSTVKKKPKPRCAIKLEKKFDNCI
jgi:hypothetical protein